MTLRRIAGLMVAVLTCNTLVVQPLLACASHASGLRHGASTVCDEMPSGGQTATAVVAAVVASDVRQGPAHTHCVPECCEALGSCSPALVMAATRPPAGVEHRRPTSPSATAPLSRPTAPEPPPPRA